MRNEDELLLLGLLDDRAMHGYMLNESIRDRLGHTTGAPRPSTAYARLAKLEERGLVVYRSERGGRRPERRVYELTEGGRTRFLELLRAALRDPGDPSVPGDALVLFLRALPRDEWRALLRERREALAPSRKSAERLRDGHPATSPGHWLARRRLAHLEAEERWLDELLASDVGVPGEKRGAERV